jgi:hypothetical protein
MIEQLEQGLPRHRICLLPLDWLRKNPNWYRRRLSKLGFPDTAIDAFITSPSLNPGEARPLRRERGSLGLLGKLLWRIDAFGAYDGRLSKRFIKVAKRQIYGGPVQSLPPGYLAVREEIGRYYAKERLEGLVLDGAP